MCVKHIVNKGYDLVRQAWLSDAGDIAFYAYVVPFLVSTIGGSLLAGALVLALQKNGALSRMQTALAYGS